MALADEIDKQLRWHLSEHPVVQRAFSGSGDTVTGTPDEFAELLFTIYGALREATLRLAEEIDTMRTT